MKKYNVWTIIEIMDEENDTYEDLKDEQRLVGKFKSLDEAIDYSNQLQKEWDSTDEGEL